MAVQCSSPVEVTGGPDAGNGLTAGRPLERIHHRITGCLAELCCMRAECPIASAVGRACAASRAAAPPLLCTTRRATREERNRSTASLSLRLTLIALAALCRPLALLLLSWEAAMRSWSGSGGIERVHGASHICDISCRAELQGARRTELYSAPPACSSHLAVERTPPPRGFAVCCRAYRRPCRRTRSARPLEAVDVERLAEGVDARKTAGPRR